MIGNANLVVLSDELARTVREDARLLDVEFRLCPELLL